ncbi:MAG: DUF4124 domain-containing protein [Candidatus Dactylopiibacterium sp.]|nr:DUF4124 domain-containing protein [Candidatus Dactylopiibacterium sp.]
MKTIIAAALLLASAASSAEIYQCTINGRKTFSDAPCADNAQRMNVRPASGAGTPTSGQADAPSAPSDLAARADRTARARILDDDIYRQEGRIRVLRAEMELQISMLKKKKQSANNNLAGAIWEQSISEEMTATANAYSAKIQSAERELESLRRQRAAVETR